MKIPFELAMERLSKSSPTTKLTEQHKKEIAELKSIYKANVADREIFVKGEIAKAVDKGHVGAIEPLEKQLTPQRLKSNFLSVDSSRAEGYSPMSRGKGRHRAQADSDRSSGGGRAPRRGGGPCRDGSPEQAAREQHRGVDAVQERVDRRHGRQRRLQDQ